MRVPIRLISAKQKCELYFGRRITCKQFHHTSLTTVNQKNISVHFYAACLLYCSGSFWIDSWLQNQQKVESLFHISKLCIIISYQPFHHHLPSSGIHTNAVYTECVSRVNPRRRFERLEIISGKLTLEW